MTQSRKTEIRTLAEKHVGKRQSAALLIECLDEIERLTELYCIALDVAYKPHRQRGIALKKLKALAEA